MIKTNYLSWSLIGNKERTTAYLVDIEEKHMKKTTGLPKGLLHIIHTRREHKYLNRFTVKCEPYTELSVVMIKPDNS